MDYQKLYEQLPKQPVKWSVLDIEKWLKFIGLSNLFPKFQSLSIDGSCINSLTEEDLREQLNIQSGIIIKKIMSWVNKGLKEYSVFVSEKETGNFNDLREITLKSKMSDPSQTVGDSKKIIKGLKMQNNMDFAAVPNGESDIMHEHKENYEEESSAMIDESFEQNKKKEYELIIQQTDGPQTSFFSVKDEGAKIGRHSSNQILILDESISRYHAEIKFEKQSFLLKDIGSTTGTFIKIDKKKPIYNNMIIEMGSNQFLADLNSTTLTLHIIEGPAVNALIEIPKQKVTIGRKPNNILNFPDDQHLSNVHSTISYFQGKYFIQDMETTNGTWQRLSVEGEASQLFPILNDTVFKIGANQSYVCKIKNSFVSRKERPNACVICCDQDKDCVYMPCKHNAACIKCSKNLKECPLCRAKIQDLVRIYKN